MKNLYTKARAKINLNLIVLNKRKDNYHNIKSIFQRINLYDEIYIEKTNTGKIEIQTNINEIENENNIIYKAYYKLKEKYENITGVKVTLKKKIPMQAGLAGGSADCASFLLAMNKMFKLKLSKEEIEEIGKSLGADVVPCLQNTPVLAEGIGEKITKIKSKFKYYIIVIKPKSNCNTKEMYTKIDNLKNKKQIDNTNKIIKGLKEKNIKLIAKNLYNTFEKAINEKFKINEIKNELIKQGAEGTLLSGSGSSIFGIYENKEIAKKAYKNLTNKYETYYCIAKN